MAAEQTVPPLHIFPNTSMPQNTLSENGGGWREEEKKTVDSTQERHPSVCIMKRTLMEKCVRISDLTLETGLNFLDDIKLSKLSH